jgi:hypothetical protein
MTLIGRWESKASVSVLAFPGGQKDTIWPSIYSRKTSAVLPKRADGHRLAFQKEQMATV